MPKQKPSKAHPEQPRHLKRPWPVVFIVVFFLLLAGMLFLLYNGLSPAYASFTRGTIALNPQADSQGRVVLAPPEDGGAARAGVEAGDILLAIDGVPYEFGVDPNTLLDGRVGEPVTITVLKLDGREETYTIIRSETYQANLEAAGLTADALAFYFIILTGLPILAFFGAGIFVLLRRPQDWLFVLAAYALLFFPVAFNYADLISNGAVILGLGWVVSVLRVLGVFLALWLLLVFPNGVLASDWARLLLVLAVFWMVPYVSAQFLPNFIAAKVQAGVWIVFFLGAIGLQFYRLLRVSTEDDVWQSRPAIVAILVCLGIYLLTRGLFFLPEDTFSDVGWTWFYMISALPMNAALVYLAVSLAGSLRRVAE